MKNKKRILIITDNPIIANRFEKEVWPLVDKDMYILNFCCSPYSKKEDFQIESKIDEVDLKKESDVVKILFYDLVISMHCKQLFPKFLFENIRCINVHPGYNPINRGWYPQVFAIINDLPIGATIHEINEEIDSGKIIDRELVPKFSHDTSLTLYNRIVNKEIELLKKNIQNILTNSYKTFAPESEGFLFLKSDFDNLCNINLDQKLSIRKTIDLFRALNHGDYKNAYFFDEQGKKVFVSIKLENE